LLFNNEFNFFWTVLLILFKLTFAVFNFIFIFRLMLDRKFICYLHEALWLHWFINILSINWFCLFICNFIFNFFLNFFLIVEFRCYVLIIFSKNFLNKRKYSKSPESYLESKLLIFCYFFFFKKIAFSI